MSYQENIFELFKAAHQKDETQFIKNWMVNWSYQDKRTKRQVDYKGDLPEDFYTYDGPNDILQWYNWQKVVKPDYFDEDRVNYLIQKSRDFDSNIISKYNLDFNYEFYDQCIARNNAQDYILANFYPMQGVKKGKKILDFGAGYGRQANLWTQEEDEDLVFVAVDAIPKSYCLQHLYYSNSNRELHDYVVEKENFKLDEKSKGIYHLPTWRFDLIPDNYFDKIIVVQVLQELNEPLVKYVLNQFKRILKDTGVLYIRDHMNAWRPTHNLDVDSYLSNNGFILEFKPHIVDKKDLHGIPRMWRKLNPEVIEQEKISVNQRLQEMRENIDATTGGRIKKIINKVKGK
jgi:ubiquinone/menaquinone biosynthesis C-methylase UbiE